MTYDRYYYSILSPEDKCVYKTLYRGIQNFDKSIAVKRSSVPIESILQYIGFDNPHIFYVDFNQISYYEGVGGITLTPTYWYTRDKAAEIEKKINTVLGKMIARVSGATDYEKEMSVHRLLSENVVYDKLAYSNLQKYHPRSNSILGVLFFKTAVCEGIAKVAKMLLNLLDIKCIVAYGMAGGEDHAWNIVKINGRAYHLDITWDINLSGADAHRYDYFNLSDIDIAKDHTPAIKYPECNSECDNYFIKNKLVAKSIIDVERIIASALLKKKKSVTFKYTGGDIDRALNAAVNSAGAFRAFSGIYTITYSKNSDQGICSVIL